MKEDDMPTIHSARTVALDDEEARTLRRAGGQFCASAAAFLLGLICVIVGGALSGSEQAEADAAAQRGVGINDLPADVLAAIHQGDSWIGSVLVALPLAGAAVLLVAGLRSAARGAAGRYRVAGMLATGLGCCSALAWIFVQVASPLYSTVLTPFVFPAVIAATALGSAAMVGIVEALRGRGVALRTGRVVGVLGVLATVGAFFVVPPFAPYLLALVLSVPLARTRPSTRI
jgi:hypothetical protein